MDGNILETVKKLEKSMKEASNYMKINVPSKNDVICFGLSKSGKSTLINLLLRNKLIVEEGFNNNFYNKGNDCLGPEIGNDISSKTIFPKKWASPNRQAKWIIWDAPGNVDNRGVVQDIINAFYVYQLFKNAVSPKILLVVDFNDIINDNISQFTTVFSCMETLLRNDIKYCFNSIAVIFTKVPKATRKGEQFNIQFVKNLLESKFLSTSSVLSETCKDFVYNLVRNEDKFGLLWIPDDGEVDLDSIGEGIHEAIDNAKEVSTEILSRTFPSISDQSLIFLGQAREKIIPPNTFLTLIQSIEDCASNKSQRVMSHSHIDPESIEGLEKIAKELKSSRDLLIKALGTLTTIDEKFEALKEMDNEIRMVIENGNLKEKYKLREFIDKLLNSSEKGDVRLQAVIKNAKITLDKMINHTQLTLSHLKKIKEENDNQLGPVGSLLGAVGNVVDVIGREVLVKPTRKVFETFRN